MDNLPLFISIAGNIGAVLLVVWLAVKRVADRADLAAAQDALKGWRKRCAEMTDDAALGAQVRQQRANALTKAQMANAERNAKRKG